MHRISRREMVAGITGATILQSETAFGTQANASVGLGIIGTGARGQYVGRNMARDGRARIVAICDIFDDRLEQIKKSVPAASEAKTYHDYR